MNRVIPGLALATCWLLLLLKGSVVLFALVLIVGLLIGAYEYGKMSLSDKSSLDPVILAVLTILPILSSFLLPKIALSGGLTLAFLLLSFWTLATYKQGFDSFGFFSKCSLGIL